MTEEEKRNIISGLGINQVLEGVGNIINVVGKIIDEDALSQQKDMKIKKTPVSSHSSQ